MREIVELLSAWNSYYVIMGSSAAALTGLMFVVITLVSGQRSASQAGIATFSTPSVVHFCCVLFTAAVMSAPLHALEPLAVILGAAGFAGIAYTVRVFLLARALSSYHPDVDDFTWHVVLPLIAYTTLFIGALALPVRPAAALYGPAAAALLLIFIAIHNAWDVVTFLAMGGADALPDAPDAAEGGDSTP